MGLHQYNQDYANYSNPASNKVGGKYMGPIRFAYSRQYVFSNWHDVDMMSSNATAKIPIVIRAEMITKKYGHIS